MPSRAEDLRTLGFTDRADYDEVRAAYKRLALETHPDRPGGDAGRFQAVTEAWERLSVRLSERPRALRCPTCDGRGKVLTPVRGSFQVLETRCATCRGTGRAELTSPKRASSPTRERAAALLRAAAERELTEVERAGAIEVAAALLKGE